LTWAASWIGPGILFYLGMGCCQVEQFTVLAQHCPVDFYEKAVDGERIGERDDLDAS
jgi:hypothetical protein